MSEAARPWPRELRVSRDRRTLSVTFDSGETHDLPAELLRIDSPSAEVQGHGSGRKTLVAGKRQVAISAVEPVGNYAVRLVFDDGHDTGLYSWDTLYRFAREGDDIWSDYLARLAAAGLGRDA